MQIFKFSMNYIKKKTRTEKVLKYNLHTLPCPVLAKLLFIHKAVYRHVLQLEHFIQPVQSM